MKFKKIPQVAFFFWNGSMSWLNYLTLFSFKKFNPDWKVILCTAESLGSIAKWHTHEQKQKYKGSDYFEEAIRLVDEVRVLDIYPCAMNDVHRADYSRQYLMYHEGGLWCDMDVLWLRRIEDIPVSRDIDLLICQIDGKRKGHFYFATGIVAARPGTVYYKTVLEAIETHYDETRYQSIGPDLVRELFPFPKNIRDVEDVVIGNMPYTCFYPYRYDKLEGLYNRLDIEPLESAVGVHWFGGAVLSMLAKNGNLEQYRGTTLDEIMKRISYEV